jgi:hypothetical protein
MNHAPQISTASRMHLQQLAERHSTALNRALAPYQKNFAVLSNIKLSFDELIALELLRNQSPEHFRTKQRRAYRIFFLDLFIVLTLCNFLAALTQRLEELKSRTITLKDLLLDSYTVRANAPNAGAVYCAAALA